MRYTFLLASVLALIGSPCEAGLHYSGEKVADLPAQWRGFLADLRMLRLAGIQPGGGVPESALRQRYAKAAADLHNLAKQRPLTADESADLGALLVRLGQTAEALEVLGAAQRQHPKHFALAANLGTAWQVYGDLANAVLYLQLACDLAPEKLRAAEQLHLKLVRFRLRLRPGELRLDDLFGVKWNEPGKLDAAERKKIPEGALGQVQRLTLWLPSDGRLIWQLGELAAAYGDLRSAADLLDLCVGEFGLNDPALFQRKARMTAAYEAFLKQPPSDLNTQKTTHTAHGGGSGIAFKSRFLLIREPLDYRTLPPINKNGNNSLTWPVLLETQFERGRPTFHQYLRDLDGLEVTLTGYMQPLFDELDTTAFLAVENPSGCWYCDAPSLNAMILIELKDGDFIRLTRDGLKITGRLKLNANDPENFLFSIVDAKVTKLE
jgi:hypothetical protein